MIRSKGLFPYTQDELEFVLRFGIQLPISVKDRKNVPKTRHVRMIVADGDLQVLNVLFTRWNRVLKLFFYTENCDQITEFIIIVGQVATYRGFSNQVYGGVG